MYRSLLKDTAIYGLSDFLLKLLAFISFPIFTHLLSLSDYGLMSLVTSLGSFAAIFLNIGISNAIQRYYFTPEYAEEAERKKLVSTGFFLLLLWSVLITILFVIASFLFRDVLKKEFEILWAYVLLCLLSNIPIQIIQYSCDTLRLTFSPWKFTFLSGIKNLAGIILSLILLYYYKQGLLGFFWANLMAPLLFIPLGIFLIRKDLSVYFDKELAKKILAYGYPFLYAGLAYWIFSSLDRWMLGEMTNSSEVGIYSVAARFGALMIFVGSAFGQAWSPFALKIHAEGAHYSEIYGNVLSYYFYAVVILGTGLCLFTREFLILFTPAEFWEASQSSYFLTMGVLIYTTTYITQIGISLKNRTGLFSILSWGATVVNFVLNFFLIPQYGSLGTSIATFVTYLVLSLGYLFYTQKLDPIKINTVPILITCAILVTSLIVSFVLETNTISVLIILVKIGYLTLIIGLSFALKIIDLRPALKIFHP